MTSHVIAYRSLELLFSKHTFHFNCFFEDFNCVFTQIRCLSRVLIIPVKKIATCEVKGQKKVYLQPLDIQYGSNHILNSNLGEKCRHPAYNSKAKAATLQPLRLVEC